MEFINDLRDYGRLIPSFQTQVSSYFVSGMSSYWELIDQSPVRAKWNPNDLDIQYFSWERIPESLRVAIANYYSKYAPGYPLSSEPKDLQYFFSGQEFQLHMWEDVVGGRKNPSINGITLAGWPTLRDWLIEEDPAEAALLGSKIHSFSMKGKRDLEDPLGYLKSLQSSKDTYRYSGYALWRQQHVVEDYDFAETEAYLPSYGYLFGWQ